jgi:hypothetical protein
MRTQELNPTDLAPSSRGNVVPSDLLGERRSFVQRCRAFLVRAAGGVDERSAQGNQRTGEDLGIVGVPSYCHGAPHSMETCLERAGGERRLAGLHLCQHCCPPRDAKRNRHLRRGSRRVKSRTRFDPQLGPEQLGTRLNVTRCSPGIARRSQTPNEQDVGVLLVGVEPDELRGVIGRAGDLATREESKRRLMKNGARRPGHMTALVLEPHLEAMAGAKDQPVQQFVAKPGQRDGLHPGAPAENIDVDECSRRQRQAQRVAAEPAVLAQPAAQNRERPAERSQRVISLGEQQGRQPLPRRRNRAAKQVREQTPGLVAARGIHRGTVPFHSRRP